MIHFIATALLSLCLLSACNNDRTQRLSKRGFYEAENDIAAYILNEAEFKLYKSTELLDEDRFSVVEFKSTVTIEDINEGKVILSIIGSNVSDSTFSVAVSSSAGLTPQSKTESPVSFEVPITNKSGDLASVKVSIEFGDNGTATQTSFLTVTAEAVAAVESDSEEEDAEETETPPEVFTSFYSDDADEFAVYEFKEVKEGTIPAFFLHHQNLERTENILRISTRLNIRKIQ